MRSASVRKRRPIQLRKNEAPIFKQEKSKPSSTSFGSQRTHKPSKQSITDKLNISAYVKGKRSREASYRDNVANPKIPYIAETRDNFFKWRFTNRVKNVRQNPKPHPPVYKNETDLVSSATKTLDPTIENDMRVRKASFISENVTIEHDNQPSSRDSIIRHDFDAIHGYSQQGTTLEASTLHSENYQTTSSYAAERYNEMTDRSKTLDLASRCHSAVPSKGRMIIHRKFDGDDERSSEINRQRMLVEMMETDLHKPNRQNKHSQMSHKSHFSFDNGAMNSSGATSSRQTDDLLKGRAATAMDILKPKYVIQDSLKQTPQAKTFEPISSDVSPNIRKGSSVSENLRLAVLDSSRNPLDESHGHDDDVVNIEETLPSLITGETPAHLREKTEEEKHKVLLGTNESQVNLLEEEDDVNLGTSAAGSRASINKEGQNILDYDGKIDIVDWAGSTSLTSADWKLDTLGDQSKETTSIQGSKMTTPVVSDLNAPMSSQVLGIGSSMRSAESNPTSGSNDRYYFSSQVSTQTSEDPTHITRTKARSFRSQKIKAQISFNRQLSPETTKTVHSDPHSPKEFNSLDKNLRPKGYRNDVFNPKNSAATTAADSDGNYRQCLNSSSSTQSNYSLRPISTGGVPQYSHPEMDSLTRSPIVNTTTPNQGAGQTSKGYQNQPHYYPELETIRSSHSDEGNTYEGDTPINCREKILEQNFLQKKLGNKVIKSSQGTRSVSRGKISGTKHLVADLSAKSILPDAKIKHSLLCRRSKSAMRGGSSTAVGERHSSSGPKLKSAQLFKSIKISEYTNYLVQKKDVISGRVEKTKSNHSLNKSDLL